MRKLMEAVKHLDEDISAGFKSVAVSMDADDAYVDGKPTTVAYIYAYENSEGSMWSQKTFGWDAEMNASEYRGLVADTANSVNGYVQEATNEKSLDWLANDTPRYKYIAFGADIGSDKELNEKFIEDVITNSMLSKMERLQGETYYKREPMRLFKIDRPNWMQRKFGRK